MASFKPPIWRLAFPGFRDSNDENGGKMVRRQPYKPVEGQHELNNMKLAQHPRAGAIRTKTHPCEVQDFQCGEDTNIKSGYTSRNRRLISATNAGRAAAPGGNFRRTTQPLSLFHSVESTGQPACLVHSPFSVEYQ